MSSNPNNAPTRHGEPEAVGEILPRVLADLDPCRQRTQSPRPERRMPSPLQEALLDADVRQLAEVTEDDE